MLDVFRQAHVPLEQDEGAGTGFGDQKSRGREVLEKSGPSGQGRPAEDPHPSHPGEPPADLALEDNRKYDDEPPEKISYNFV